MAKVAAGGAHAVERWDRIQPQAWTEPHDMKPADALELAFAENVVLEASVLVRPIEGLDRLKTVMAAACKIYEALSFTQETTYGPRTYLEWKAEALGNVEFLGVTALTKNDEGKISRIRLSARTTPTQTGRSQSSMAGQRAVGSASTSHEIETEENLA